MSLVVLEQKLSTGGNEAFYSALSELRRLDPMVYAPIIVRVLVSIAGATGFSERQKSERVRALGGQGLVTAQVISGIIARSAELSPGVRNALSSFLSSEARARLSIRAVPAEVTPDDLVVPTAVVGTPAVERTELVLESEARAARPISEAPQSTEFGGATVLLLSRLANQEGNATLLRRFDLGPVPYDSWERAYTDVQGNNDVCGCVVDGSFLYELDDDAQRQFFRDVGGYSSFFWLRIDETNLRISVDEVRQLIRDARCHVGPLPAEMLSFQPTGTLRESEIPDIIRAREYLRASLGIKITLKNISDEESLLLMGAVKRHADAIGFQPVDVSTVEIQFLNDGLSGARTAVVRPNGDGRAIVAKVHRRSSVVEEIRRFDVFIRGWDNELRPQAFVHNDSAVILFDIIPVEGDQAQPAEMLEACLRKLWIDELYAGDNERAGVELKAANIRTGLETLAAKLAALNLRRPVTDEFPAHGYPDPAYIERVEARGIVWDLGDDAITARSKAKEIFDGLWPQATVHGDLHLKNVLIRGDRDPHLIDYAHSGPGHPAVDLVRLELALYSGHCREFGSDDSFVDLQTRLSVGVEDQSSLERAHGTIFRAKINEVSVAGCIATRNSAIRVVEAYGGNITDYLATKYLLAWQSLLLDGRQTNLIKGVIRALTPAILAM